MKLTNSIAVAVCLLLFASCGKELSLELAKPIVQPVDTANVIQDFLADKKFQLRGFYSDIPIDYDDTDDTVKSETNLWGYVSFYLKDDINKFSTDGTNVSIEQNAHQMPGVTDSVLNRQYKVIKTADGIVMNFLDYQYNPLTYQLNKIGEDYFILSIKWKNGATLYSRFEAVTE